VSATVESMDTDLVADEYILVPKALFVGLVENTRDLIGSQQWRKGTTQSNDRQLDALEQEVAQAEQLLQQPPTFPERQPYEPADTYDALRQQFRSLDMLERNTRKLLQHYQQKDAAQEREKLLASHEALNSEREANQRLTEEVERLEGALEQFRELVGEAQKAKAFRVSLKGSSEAERIAVGSDARDWDISIVNKLTGIK
jgi:exonuclease VII large subunit